MEKTDTLDRPFNSFRVGESASLARTVSERDVALFSELSGDRNPLHTEQAYAASTRYGKRIAHGLLVAAPISALAGHHLPGRRCVLLEVRARFVGPVFPGDRLIYRGTIVHVSPATRVLKVQIEVTNQEGVVVLKGSYDGQVLPDGQEEEKA